MRCHAQMCTRHSLSWKRRCTTCRILKQTRSLTWSSWCVSPRYLGDGMLRTLRKEIEDFIYKFPKKDGNTSEAWMEQLAQEYTAFQIEVLRERQQSTFLFKMIGKSKTVLQWWIANGTDWPLLQNLALCVFSMAASSATSEWNFSTFWIYSFKAMKSPWYRESEEIGLCQDKQSSDVRCAAQGL
ncbi:hypothetical protein BSLG_07742 [Paramuricea clavata]|uniref:Uncharacterized protein n=1 Tax=Paramuricea clavata TaxID=317549 RepID=A0A6S7GPS3_PARCT|nr:hypothetical protein BSLG_07742 [Paramuricea clavata]